jgi:hypothetical protein
MKWKKFLALGALAVQDTSIAKSRGCLRMPQTGSKKQAGADKPNRIVTCWDETLRTCVSGYRLFKTTKPRYFGNVSNHSHNHSVTSHQTWMLGNTDTRTSNVASLRNCSSYSPHSRAAIAQSVQRLAKSCTLGGSNPAVLSVVSKEERENTGQSRQSNKNGWSTEDRTIKKNCDGGEIFRTRPDWPWGPHSLLHNVYRVSLPGVNRPGRGVNRPPHLAPRLKKE